MLGDKRVMTAITQSSSPAALPAANATETAIEFGFRGPRVLHSGTIVRAQNHGYLVHMIDLIGVRSKAVVPEGDEDAAWGAPQKAFPGMEHTHGNGEQSPLQAAARAAIRVAANSYADILSRNCTYVASC